MHDHLSDRRPVAAMLNQPLDTRFPRASFRFDRESIALAAILLLAAIPRLLWLIWFPVPPESDFASLLRVSREMAAGNWPASSYGWVFHGVGYPLLLFPLTLVTDSLVPLRLENLLFQLGMIVAVWWLTRSLFGRIPALVAACCAALMPGMWMMTTLIAKENPIFLLFPLLMILLRHLDARRYQCAVGALIALMAMIRPNFLSFIPIVAVIVGITAVKQRTVTPLGWFVAGVALVLVPIVGLNVRNDGPPLPTAAASWQLWEVNNERATGGYFAPNSTDDDPFRGLPGGETTRRIQAKLGFQFIVANPVTAVNNAWRRHLRQWRTDTAGYVWSYDRADPTLQHRVPFRARTVRDLTDWSYVAVLVLALIGAIRGSNVRGVGLTVLLPVGWALLTLPLGEGNIRYHLVITPFLCILAGAACRPIPRTWSVNRRSGVLFGSGIVLILVGLLAGPVDARHLAAWDWPNTTAPGWVVVLVGIALTSGVVLTQGPARLWQVARVAHLHPQRAWASVLAIIVLLIVGAGVAWSRADTAIDHLNAVDPGGWERYETPPTGQERGSLPLTLIKPDLPGTFRQVSYPDAVVLTYDQRPVPGTILGLRRTFDDLTPGTVYQLYLQVYDPGATGDPREQVTVSLDDEVVWERETSTAREPGWYVIYVEWVARSDTGVVRVERIAGTTPVPSVALAPAVRNLHLYPTY